MRGEGNRDHGINMPGALPAAVNGSDLRTCEERIMFSRVVFVEVACVIGLVAACSAVHADTIIGPGQQTVDGVGGNDGNYDTANVVDTGNAVTLLSGGQYEATSFEYQFAMGAGATGLGGTVQPFLATLSGGAYTPIALGSVVSYSGTTDWVTTQPFGGSNLFTVSPGTTVYAGFHWVDVSGDTAASPIGFAGSGSTADFGAAVGWAGNIGGEQPVVNTPLSAFWYLNQTRAYDFDIRVTSVPEPSSLAMLVGLGVASLLAYAWRRRK